MKVQWLPAELVAASCDIISTCPFDEQRFNPTQTRARVQHKLQTCEAYDDLDLAGVFDDDELIGCVLICHDATYAGIDGGVFTCDEARYQEILMTVFTWMRGTFNDRLIVVGVHARNELARIVLTHMGKLELTANQFEWQLGMTSAKEPPLVPLTQSAFQALAGRYDALFPQMYWTADRILTKFDHWLILSDEAGLNMLAAYLYPQTPMCEVFASQIASTQVLDYWTTLQASASAAGATTLLWMVGDDDVTQFFQVRGDKPVDQYYEYSL